MIAPKKHSKIIDAIKREIEKSGFPLELYVLNICSKKNTGRMPSIRYIYEGNLREIDLWAFFEEINLNPKKGENLQHTSVNMIIECKKSKDKPWVFFSSGLYPSTDVFCFTKYVSGFDLYFRREKKHSLLSRIYKNLRKNHYMDKKVPRCITYFEAFKDHSSPSEIYKAIDSLLSFLCYKRDSFLKRRSELDFSTDFLFPIIVLDGSLFEARVNGDEINVEEQNHIQLRTDYREEIFIVDVVKKEYFEKFFNLIEKDFLEFVNSINKIKFSKEYKSKLKIKHEQKMKEFEKYFPLELYVDIKKAPRNLHRRKSDT